LFGGGIFEIGFFLFIAYLLFGPKKLPEIARTIGKWTAELRRASNELRNSLEEEIRNLDRVPDSGQDHSSNSNSNSSSTASMYGHHDPEPASEESGTRS
jgi:Sec-independent protein translocase protein TatA